MTEYANPDVLVSTDWLEAQLDDPDVRVIEVDEDTTAYEKGHIRGAVGWNWTTDLHTPVGRDYLDQGGFAELLSVAGVGSGTTVVLYGGNNNWFAAYAYWLLKLRGFDDVKLLDGGRKKWELESRELVQDVPSFEPSDHVLLGDERPQIRALRDEVISKVGSPTGFVDVRSPEEFRGEKLAPDHLPQEQAQVPGHIAGAANIPWVKAANDDGTFKSADELKALYEAEGITADRDVIAYCRIGERSSHTWFALQELLGYPNVKNYDGSWTEYGSLVGAPVELGWGGDMSEVDRLKDANASFAERFDKGDLEIPPARPLVVLTCIDARVDPAASLGLDIGDAHVIRNAGGRATDDAIRSLLISSWLLGTREFAVIHHTDCGMTKFTDPVLRDMILDQAGVEVDMEFLSFEDPEQSTRDDVDAIRGTKGFPDGVTVSGHVYDVRTGRLHEVVGPSALG